MKPVKSNKLRNSARGRECTMHVAGVCNHNPDTTVLAHINTDGSSMGAKTDDFSACFACSDCHAWHDHNKGSMADRLFYSRRAIVRTWRIWVEDGFIKL